MSRLEKLAAAATSRGRNASAMAIGTLLSRVTGLGRLAVLSWALGISSLSDVFNLSNNAPNTFFDLLIGGVLASTMIPVMVKASSRVSDQEASEALSAIVTVSIAALVAATLVFELIAGLVIQGYMLGNHSPTRTLQLMAATNLLRFFAPQLFFYGLVSVLTSVLNTRGRFALPAFAPVANNLVAIATLVAFHFLFGNLNTKDAIASLGHFSPALLLLGLGTTAGVGLQCLVVILGMRNHGYHLRFNFDVFHPAIREIGRLSGWTFGYVLGNQISLFVILALADAHSPGSVSAYNNAYLFFQLPYGIAAYSIMAAIIPGLAASFSHGELRQFRRSLTRGTTISVALLIPAAFGYLAMGRQITELLLGHGAARAHGIELTTRSLYALAIGLPGFGAYLASIQALQAARLARAVFWVYAIENGLTVVLAFALVSKLGVFGLSLAVSVSYSIATVFALRELTKRHLGPNLASVSLVWLKFLPPSIAMAVIIKVVSNYLGPAPGAKLMVELIVELIAGMLAFGLTLWVSYSLSVLAIRRRTH